MNIIQKPLWLNSIFPITQYLLSNTRLKDRTLYYTYCSYSEDNHIECRRKNKQIRFERNPDEDNRTVCVVKADTNETFACYPGDEGETIKYTFDPSGYDISVEDKFNRFCLTYLSPPDVPSLCVSTVEHG